MEKYTLIGVDSNAFSVMAYVQRALRKEKLNTLIPEYQQKATALDYDYLIMISLEYLDKANEVLNKRQESV